MGNEGLAGVWMLVSAVYRRADGSSVDYLGDSPFGLLIYTTDGYMSVQLVRSGRPVFASGDRLGGTAAEIKLAFEGYHGYFGTYTVNENERTVTHHLEGCSFPNWVGVEQKRQYALQREYLTLQTPPLLIGTEPAVGYLLWRRVKVPI